MLPYDGRHLHSGRRGVVHLTQANVQPANYTSKQQCGCIYALGAQASVGVVGMLMAYTGIPINMTGCSPPATAAEPCNT
jgi:hypothetical protein